MLYQAEVRPATMYRTGGLTTSGLGVQRALPKIVECTLSPGMMPSAWARPALSSSTARIGSLDGIGVCDIGTALAAMEEIVPSERMKMMSSGRIVFFIQNEVITVV